MRGAAAPTSPVTQLETAAYIARSERAGTRSVALFTAANPAGDVMPPMIAAAASQYAAVSFVARSQHTGRNDHTTCAPRRTLRTPSLSTSLPVHAEETAVAMEGMTRSTVTPTSILCVKPRSWTK